MKEMTMNEINHMKEKNIDIGHVKMKFYCGYFLIMLAFSESVLHLFVSEIISWNVPNFQSNVITQSYV